MEEILKIKRRIGRKSKNRFLNLVEKELEEYGYTSKKHTFKGLFKSVNLETEEDDPGYLFIAHYDTFTIMPFWLTWLMRLVGINRQILMIGLMMVTFAFVTILQDKYPGWGDAVYYTLIASMLTMLIPTPVNYDDNTSGVITLLKLAKQCKEKDIKNVKFLFADNEELGLIGSSAQAAYWSRKQTLPPHCKIISIDCVGGTGEIPLLIRNSRSSYEPALREALSKKFGVCKSSRMILPASDNFSFKGYGAINISFVKKSLLPGGYCIPNIHTPKDNKLDESRMDHLAEMLADTISQMKKETA